MTLDPRFVLTDPAGDKNVVSRDGDHPKVWIPKRWEPVVGSGQAPNTFDGAARADGVRIGEAQGVQPMPVGVGAEGDGGGGSTWGGQALDIADNYVGVPYVFGAASGNTAAFDCSSYAQYVYGRMGVQLPRVAQDQYNATQRISADQARPGDLVFFQGTYDAGTPVTHVAVYMGNGKFIGAQGDDVNFADLSSPYWKAHFYGFGRAPGVDPGGAADIVASHVQAAANEGSIRPADPAQDTGEHRGPALPAGEFFKLGMLSPLPAGDTGAATQAARDAGGMGTYPQGADQNGTVNAPPAVPATNGTEQVTANIPGIGLRTFHVPAGTPDAVAYFLAHGSDDLTAGVIPNASGTGTQAAASAPGAAPPQPQQPSSSGSQSPGVPPPSGYPMGNPNRVPITLPDGTSGYYSPTDLDLYPTAPAYRADGTRSSWVYSADENSGRGQFYTGSFRPENAVPPAGAASEGFAPPTYGSTSPTPGTAATPQRRGTRQPVPPANASIPSHQGGGQAPSIGSQMQAGAAPGQPPAARQSGSYGNAPGNGISQDDINNAFGYYLWQYWPEFGKDPNDPATRQKALDQFSTDQSSQPDWFKSATGMSRAGQLKWVPDWMQGGQAWPGQTGPITDNDPRNTWKGTSPSASAFKNSAQWAPGITDTPWAQSQIGKGQDAPMQPSFGGLDPIVQQQRDQVQKPTWGSMWQPGQASSGLA